MTVYIYKNDFDTYIKFRKHIIIRQNYNIVRNDNYISKRKAVLQYRNKFE